MKDFYTELELNGSKFLLCFNLNVMESIQAEYGTLDKWQELTSGKEGEEPDAKAIIFGFKEMLNEGIDINNEKNGTNYKPLTHKQVGRFITELGLENIGNKLSEAVINASKNESKNA